MRNLKLWLKNGWGGSLYGIADHINLRIIPGLTYYDQSL